MGTWIHSVRNEANGSNALGRNRINDEYSPGLTLEMSVHGLPLGGVRGFASPGNQPNLAMNSQLRYGLSSCQGQWNVCKEEQLKVQGFRFRVRGSGFGIGVSGSGFRVSGAGLMGRTRFGRDPFPPRDAPPATPAVRGRCRSGIRQKRSRALLRRRAHAGSSWFRVWGSGSRV